jgi:hypothetical protein
LDGYNDDLMLPIYLSMDKERRIRKFSLLVVDCVHKNKISLTLKIHINSLRIFFLCFCKHKARNILKMLLIHRNIEYVVEMYFNDLGFDTFLYIIIFSVDIHFFGDKIVTFLLF